MVAYSPFAELLERARQGDHSAWQVLWEQYVPHVERVLRRQCSRQPRVDWSDRDDARQSTFRRVFQHLQHLQFDSEQHFINFIMRCAENVVRHKVRDRIRPMPGDRLHDPEEAGSCVYDSALDALIRQETLEGIRRGVSEDAWTLLEMRLGGRRWKEIADALGTRAEIVRSRFRRVMKRLRDAVRY